MGQGCLSLNGIPSEGQAGLEIIAQEGRERPPVPPSPPPSVVQGWAVSSGKMVTSAEFTNIKNLFEALTDFQPKTSEEIEAKRKATQALLDRHLKALEDNTLSGRWVRKFLESELDARFSQLPLKGETPAAKNIIPRFTSLTTSEECLANFWKEVKFCYEGLKTLEQLKEYDTWLSQALYFRCQYAFKGIKGVSYKKRITQLDSRSLSQWDSLQVKISAEQYKKRVSELTDALFDYVNKTSLQHMSTVVKAKDELSNVMVRPPKGEWVAHKSRKERQFLTFDLFEVRSKEDVKVILTDRRYFILEGEAIVTGWEITPQIPENLAQEIADLIKLLGDEDWPTREKATDELIEIGEPTMGLLKEATESKDPEVRTRANIILKKIEQLKDPASQIRNYLESCINNGQAPDLKQLKQMSTLEEIIAVVRPMLEGYRQSRDPDLQAALKILQETLSRCELEKFRMRPPNR